MIPKSHPKAIAEASVTNTTMSLTIALAEHDCDSYQVGGTLPVTKEVHKAFTIGHGVCCITTNWNYFNGTNVANFHKYRRFLFHLALDLAGGIHLHGLVPLQSIEKNLGGAAQEYVWMGGLHALCWMVAYVIKNHPKLLQKSDNKLVCIVIPSGNPRLEHSSIIWRFWCI